MIRSLPMLVLTLALALTSGAGLGCGDDTGPRSGVAVPEPLAAGGGQAAAVERTVRGYVGVLAPRSAADVAAPFSGKLVELLVNLGDVVEVGTPLAKLDEKDLLRQIEQTQAELAQRQSAIVAASAASSSAYKALRNAQSLFRTGDIKGAEVDTARAAASTASANVASAKAAAEEVRVRIKGLQEKKKDTTVRSPIAGKVSNPYVKNGDQVGEGMPLLRVISSDELFVKFAIDAEHMGQVKAGDPVTIVVEKQGIETAGKVVRVAPEIDPVAQRIIAEAELSAQVAEAQAGLMCRVIHGAAGAPPSGPPPATPRDAGTPAVAPDAGAPDGGAPGAAVDVVTGS